MLRLIAALLVLLAIVWLLLSLLAKIKRLTTRQHQASQHDSHANHPQSSKQAVNQDLIACTHCRIFVPIDDSIRFQGRYYCSKSCLPDTNNTDKGQQ